LVFYTQNLNISASMTLEEKYAALVKSYQSISTTNHGLQRKMEDIEGQNVYLRK